MDTQAKNKSAKTALIVFAVFLVGLYFAMSPVREANKQAEAQEAARVAALTPAQRDAEAQARQKQAQADAAKAAADNKAEADRQAYRSMITSCEVSWEIKYKSHMKDPSSLDWDRKSATLGMYKKTPVIIVPYRAKNGFNALTLERAVCEIDVNKKEVVAVFEP